MTDPNTPIQPTNNPQDLIDQALGSTPTPAVTPDPTPTLPVPEALTTPATVKEETPMSPDSALPPAETVPTELTAKSEVAPVMSEPPVDTKPMGEDMPLAFMGSAPADTTTSQPVSNLTVEPIAPVSVPPILTGSTANTTNDMGGKPKRKTLKVVGIVAALFISFGVIGSVAYQMLTGVSLVAILQPKGPVKDIDSKEDCNGESNGGWLVWRNGECKVTGSSGSEDKNGDGVGDKDTTNPNIGTTLNSEGGCKGAGAGYTWCASVDSEGKSYAFCETTGKGCNNAAIEKGYTIVYGSGVSTAPVAGGKSCNCGGSKTVYFTASNGVCDQTDASKRGFTTDGYNYNEQGLCAVAGYFKSDGTYVYGKKLDRNGKEYDITKWFDSFTCDANGCRVSNSACSVVRYTCADRTSTACLDNEKVLGTSGGFEGKCGTVEQIDVMCGGNYVQSRTKLNGECGEKDTPTPSTPTITTNPTLMCSSLTRTPTTTPEVGDKVTFTCVGASTPAGAVSLTYKFRYSLNSGAYVAMTNKTATTSELTIASCGSYKVQCQACGTINGVLTCDPNWTAATQ